MPELPEVETVRRGLVPVLEGHRIARLDLRRRDLRFPFPDGMAEAVAGRLVIHVGRRAKYLLIALEGGATLLAHLGMSGRMLIGPADRLDPGPHDHAILVTDDGIAVRFNDARRFGCLDLVPDGGLERHRLLVGLGPEPLGNEFSGAVLAANLAGRLSPIKAALLDQKTVAGLGNIYVCEALFGARLSPRRLALTVTGARAERLAQSIRQVLTRAIAAGGSSLRDYVQASGELGYFQHEWAVYGREGEPCPTCICVTGIARIVQSNRSTYFCARRQR